MTKKRFDLRLCLAVIALLLVGSLLACGSEPPPADTLRVALDGNPTDLDPRYATDANSTRIIPLVYEGLLTDLPSGELAPALAERFEVVDPLTYRFVLRAGLRWQDGRPLTSADVAATFRFLADPANKCPSQDDYARIAVIETPDERTVVVRLREPFSPFLMKMTRAIVPANLPDPHAFAAQPIGSGPYRLASFDRGRRVVLEAWPEYRGGPPPIRRVVFDVIANDTSRMLRLKKGEIDLVVNAVPPYAVRFFARLPGLRLLRQPGVNYSYLGFNFADPHGLVSDARVRRAIAHAIDRRQIIKAVLFDMAQPATGLLAPSNWAYDGAVRTYAYDPALAKRLLDEAGHPDSDGDGPLPRFTLSYKTSTNKLRMRIAEVMAEQLARVGIRLERRSLEWGAFFADIKSGNFQTYTLTWVGVTDPDQLYYVFHSSMRPPTGGNRGRYANAQVDRWLEDARRTFDRAERQRLYGLVQKQLAEDCAYVSLWWTDDVVALTDGLDGFVINPLGDFRSLAAARLRR
jgi:peptide/nickel transport system substrate-binding protein